ncbi:hypothetical protein SAMN05428940_4644 [Streptomyces sp. 2133.1]|nr:hypothetical protein BX261_4617 [Streptomyces sp. 2321.6]SED38255.1 hypothetical protein SAMN05428940_4644 [Streptomyces sp. 2133.1]
MATNETPCNAAGEDAGGQPQCTTHDATLIRASGAPPGVYKCGTEYVVKEDEGE